MLFIFINFSNENRKNSLKILIHLTAALILADTLWILFASPGKTIKKTVNIIYWQSLVSINSLCFFLAVVEAILKLILVGLFLYDYRSIFSNDFRFLLNFDYKMAELSHPEIPSNYNNYSCY